MAAFASIQSTSVPLARAAAPVGVYRYSGGNYQYLSNIRVLAIQFREGPDAGVARFRYVFDVNNPAVAPNSFQDAMSVDSTLPGIVANDDRLVVITYNPDGSAQALFDGFAQVPELGLSPDRQVVTFVAFGVAIREWDTPIAGALMRDADNPSTVSDYETDLVIQFNRDGLPNATPEGADAVDVSGETYPTFLDPLVLRNPRSPAVLDAADGDPLPLLPAQPGRDLRQQPRRHAARRVARQPCARPGQPPARRPVDLPERTDPRARRPGDREAVARRGRRPDRAQRLRHGVPPG